MTTLTDAQATLDAYIAAEKAVLAGKTAKWGTREWTLPDLGEIRAGRREWERKVAEIARRESGCDRSRSFAATATFDC